MNTNVGYLFYKDYYESLSYRWRNDKFVAEFDGTKQNQQLFAQELLSSVVKQKEKYIDPIQNESFELQTTYPGLLIGSGDNHEILSSEKDQNNKAYVKNELKLGFHFDHTTGLPIISGSSVKGAIRSGFEFETGYIIELLDVILKENETWNALDDPTKRKTVAAIENTIFEQEGDRCVYERDIFLDAFPVATGHSKKQFLGNDYITPHASPVKSPVPVQFLKVLPQVTYYFAFRLADSEINFEGGSLTLMRTQKTELFLKILLDFGVGAKTNVGYGQFEIDPRMEIRILTARREEEESRREKEKESARIERAKRAEEILTAEKQRDEERQKANLDRKGFEDQEMKEHGLNNLLAPQSNFNSGKDLIDRFVKFGDVSTQTEAIMRFVRNVLAGLQNQKDKKKWNRKGKDNWNHVQKWIGAEKATQMFNEFKK